MAKRVSYRNYPDSWEIMGAGFTTRTRNPLVRWGYKTMAELETASANDLLDVYGFGYKALLDFARRMRELERTVNPTVFDWLTEMER